MDHCSRSLDVRSALERAKKKICGLEHKLSALGTVSDSEENEVRALPWTQSKELKESLVDMYKDARFRRSLLQNPHGYLETHQRANPNVNQELRHRLSPPHSRRAAARSPSPGAVLPKSPDLSGDSCRSTAAVCLQSAASSPGPGKMEEASSPAPFTHTDTKDHAPSHQVDGGGHAHPGTPDGRGLSREKNVSFLLKELDSLRAVNNKLQLQLVHQQKEVEERLLGEELHTSSQHLPQAVFQELCAAQRERDQALMSRLRLANEERDEALLRAKRLQQQAEDEMEDRTPDFNMAELDVEAVLRGLAGADSAGSVRRQGAVLLALLQKARQRRRDITTQEMTVLLEERDRTATRLSRLELLNRENHQETHDACKEQLGRAERERDELLENNQRLEEQLRRYARPQGETQQDPRAPGDGGPVPQGPLTPPPPEQTPHPSGLHPDRDQQLQASLQAERDASARIHKLERLVEVLRKKVGTGNLRSVI